MVYIQVVGSTELVQRQREEDLRRQEQQRLDERVSVYIPTCTSPHRPQRASFLSCVMSLVV